MNAYMRIQIRIAAQNVKTLDDIERKIKSIKQAGSTGGGGGFWSQQAKAIENMGKNLQWTGRQLEYRFTAPIMAAGKAALGWAMDNARATTQIRKVYGDLGMSQAKVNSDVDKLGKAFRILSDLMGINQAEVIEMGVVWAQAGANGAALAEAVRLSAEASVLGELDTKTAAQDLIAIQTQWGLSTRQLKDALALLNVVENETSVGFGDLIGAMVRGGATARTAGVDIQHYAALVAALVPAAGTAAQAGNALKTILTRIVAPTKMAADTLEALGIKLNTSNWQSKTAVQRLQELAQGYKNLTGPQQVFVAKQLGSLYQISKFSELMRALVNDTSQYNRALRASGNEQRNAAVYQRELGIFLSSQPQTFKILTTQMKNMATEAIVPLIPLLINLMKGAAGLVRWFTSLPPNVQKSAAIFLLLLAALGPVLAYLGAFIILGAQVIKAWREIGKAAAFTGRILKAVGGGLGELANGAGLYMARIGDFFIRGYQGLVGIVTKFWAWIIGADTAGDSARLAAEGGFQAGRLGIAEAANVAYTAQEMAFLMALLGAHLAGYTDMAAFDIAYQTQRLAIGAAGGAAFVGQEVATMGASVAVAESAWTAISLSAVLGWAAVIAVVIAAMVIFRKQIWAAVKDVAGYFGKLPGAVIGVFRALVQIVKSAALAFYHWLSYFNPFARHSPSLVDQVIKGVDIISAKYASLKNASGVFRQAAADYRTFLAATSGASGALADKDFAAQRKDIVAVAPDAGPATDALYASVKRLRALLPQIAAEYQAQAAVVAVWSDRLDAANKNLDVQNKLLEELQTRASAARDALDAAQSVLDTLSNTPIAGMKAMNDAIFANEMAQKRLRLEMLRLEEAGQRVDDLRSRLAALNGDLELLAGQQKDLRLAGAGSDILGPIGDQIDSLQQSKSGIREQIEGLQGMQDQLDELGRQGEILDLENSLQFDPLKRQIDEVTNSMQEMPFDELLAKIIAQKGVVAELTTAWKAAEDAVTGQQAVVDQAQASRDALQASYDAEKIKLDALGQAYDDIANQISDMEQAISDLASAAAKGADDLDKLSDAAQALADAGLGDFADPGGLEGLAQGGDLDALVKQWQEELDKSFGDFDPWKAMKGAFDKMKTQALGWIREHAPQIGLAILGGILAVFLAPEALAGSIAFAIGAALALAAGKVAPAAGRLGMAVLGGIADAANKVWQTVLYPIFNAIATAVTTILGPPLMWLWHEVFEPAFGGIAAAVSAAWQVIEPIVTFFGQVFYALGAIIIDVIYLQILVAWAVLRGAFELAWPIIKAIIDAFGAAAMWLWHNAIEPAFHGIAAVATWLWQNAIQPVFNFIVAIIRDVVGPIISWLWHSIVEPAFNAIGTVISAAWNSVIKPVLQGLVDFFNATLGPIFTWLWHQVIEPAWTGISNFTSSIWNGIGNAMRGGINIAIDAINILIAGVNKLSDILPGINFHIDPLKELGSGNGYTQTGPTTFVKKNSGGLIPGRGANIDSVQAMLTRGEFVMRRQAVDAIGVNRLNEMNRTGRFNSGGMVHLNMGGFPGVGAVKGIAGGIAGLAGDALAAARKAAAIAAFGPIHALANAMLNQIGWKIPRAIGLHASNGVYDWVKGAKHGAYVRGSMGGSLLNVGEGGVGHDEAVVPLDQGDWPGGNTYNFYGDLEFPNITDGSDAQDFLDNLESLAG